MLRTVRIRARGVGWRFTHGLIALGIRQRRQHPTKGTTTTTTTATTRLHGVANECRGTIGQTLLAAGDALHRAAHRLTGREKPSRRIAARIYAQFLEEPMTTDRIETLADARRRLMAAGHG